MKSLRILCCLLVFYTSCTQLHAQEYRVAIQNGKKTLLNNSGNPVVIPGDTDYTDIEWLYNKYIITSKAGGQRLYTADLALKAQGRQLYMPVQDFAFIKDQRDSLQVINIATGTTLLKSINHTYYFNDPRNHKTFGIVLDKFDKGSAVLTMNGKLLFSPGKCGTISSFTGEYFIVYKAKENVYGIADLNGNMLRNWAPGRLEHLAGPSYKIETHGNYEIFNFNNSTTTRYQLMWFANAGLIRTKVRPGEIKVKSALYYGYINPYTGRMRPPLYITHNVLLQKHINNIPYTLLQFKRGDGAFDIYNVERDTIIATSTAAITNNMLGDTLVPVRNTAGNYALLTYSGKALTPYSYRSMEPATEGSGTKVLHAEGWGILDNAGKLITQQPYESITRIVNDYFIYSMPNHKYGVGKNGQPGVMGWMYDNIIYLGHDAGENGLYYFLAETGGSQAIFNSRNERLTPFELTGKPDLNFADGGIFKTTVKGKPAAYKYNGTCIVPALYDALYIMSHTGFISPRRGSKYGLVDLEGKLLLDCSYDEIDDDGEMYDANGEKYLMVYQNNKRGIISEKGEWRLQPAYDKINTYNFNDIPYAVIWQNGKAGIYTGFKKQLAGCEYENIYFDEGYLENNLIKVKQNKLYGLLDTTGKAVLPAEFDNIEYTDMFDECALYAYKKKLTGLYTCTGKKILPHDFVKKELSEDGIIFTTKTGEKYLVSPNFTVTQL